MTDNYLQLKISTDQPVNDLIIGFLSDVGAEGFIEETNELSCYFADRKWNPSFRTDVNEFLINLKKQGKIKNFSIEVLAVRDQDWNREWEDSVVPVEVTNNVAIKPSWKDYYGDAKIVIEIDPKMSFGTGHHETTRMMIGLLEKFIKGGEAVLDIGTGTGVLAIAAVMLGAKKCAAIDNDDWSIENARENIGRNGVANKIELMKGDLASVPSSEFDIVVANLNRNTLLYLRDEIYDRTARGGRLLLTGVLTLDEESIISAYAQKGFKSEEIIHEAEWSALVLKK
ncbi:MAG TPA: 50S ribosomal protein L11 methyltransferase [Candidatus Acidoferrales bacterium]|nr:50S ribosomal protein L11 methyltransferase [Candidatus Acidoferrales bacterium]